MAATVDAAAAAPLRTAAGSPVSERAEQNGHAAYNGHNRLLLPNGATNGIANGIANGITNGVTNGIQNGVTNGVTNGVCRTNGHANPVLHDLHNRNGFETNGHHKLAADVLQLPQQTPLVQHLQWPGVRQAAAELLCGASAGVGWVAVGQPLDTIKVRMQANPAAARRGALSVAAALAAEGGAAAFYRGAAPEFALSLVCGTFKFPLYARLREHAVPGAWGSTDTARRRRAAFGRGEAARVGAAGALAGLLMAPIMTPLELLKCRLQVLHANSRGGPRPRARDALPAGGRYFTGIGPTALRCTAGNAVYFGTVESARARLEVWGAGPWASRCVAGGSAGAAFWALLFPVDCVKTRMQTSAPTSAAAESFAAACRDLWREAGWRGFTRGMPITAFRSFPASAAGYAAFDATHQWCCARGHIAT